MQNIRKRYSKTKIKNYKDYLAEENVKRKAKGWYLFKYVPIKTTRGFRGKVAEKQTQRTVNPSSERGSLVQVQPFPPNKKAEKIRFPAPPQIAASANNPVVESPSFENPTKNSVSVSN